MRIHTLGPKTTDSYLAADHLIDNKKSQDCFTFIF